MIYFVSGHRDLTEQEFEEHYVPLIRRVIKEDSLAEFVVGDWEGCDKIFLDYISKLEIETWVSIYYVEYVRNKPTIYDNYPDKTFLCRRRETYDECDASMTEDSDFDIAWIRPGKENSHTAKNIKRRYNL